MTAHDPTGRSLLATLSDELADAVETAAASVVTVYARQRMPGSGIAWTNDGLIVTASHVVERDEDITVGLPDGRTVPATLAGRDHGTDIALLSTGLGDLDPARRSAVEPRVGHLALAVGRPGASGAMASFGAITNVGGEWRTPRGGTVEGYLRADAAMLPGFSGGPLVDGEGAVIGINSSTLGRGGGLTIPCAAIDTVVEALRAHGRVRRGYLGVGTQQVRIPQAQVDAHRLADPHGLMIVQLENGSPAERGGLFLGDVIVAVDGDSVVTIDALQAHLDGGRIGKVSTVRVLRGGEATDVPVTIGDRQ